MNNNQIKAEEEIASLTWNIPKNVIDEQALVEELTKKCYCYYPQHVYLHVLKKPINGFKFAVWYYPTNTIYGFKTWKEAERFAKMRKEVKIMNEKELVELFGLENVWNICNLIKNTARALRASGSVPVGKENRVLQYEVVIKYLIGKNRIDFEKGRKLLENLDLETVQSILHIAGVDEDKVKVWLL